MSITVDVSELTALASRFAGAGPIIQRHLVKGVGDAGKRVEGTGKGHAPVVTGHYRRNITSKATAIGGGAEAIVQAGAPYSERVEKGRGPVVAGPGKVLPIRVRGGGVIFRKRAGPAKGQWVMRRALDANRNQIVQILRRAGEDAANEVLGGI